MTTDERTAPTREFATAAGGGQATTYPARLADAHARHKAALVLKVEAARMYTAAHGGGAGAMYRACDRLGLPVVPATALVTGNDDSLERWLDMTAGLRARQEVPAPEPVRPPEPRPLPPLPYRPEPGDEVVTEAGRVAVVTARHEECIEDDPHCHVRYADGTRGVVDSYRLTPPGESRVEVEVTP